MEKEDVTPVRRRRYEEESYVPHYSSPEARQNAQKQAEHKRVTEEAPVTRQVSRRQDGGQAPVGRPAPHVQNNGVNKKQVKKKKHTVGRILAIIQGILSLVVLGLLFTLDVLPLKFLALAAVLLIVLFLYTFISQLTKKGHILGKIVSLVLCIGLIMGSYYLAVTNSFLGGVTGSSVKVDNMIIAVLKDNPAESLADAVDYTFGIQTAIDAENTEKTLAQVEENIGKEVNIKMCDSIYTQVNDLYSGAVDVIIYNEAFIADVYEEHPTFDDDIRVLDNVKIETKVEVIQSDKKVTKEPFTVYISGNDSYGHISTSGRSDVNILATVNPETKQVLLTTTPRDYYVELPGVSGGSLDKLTHAGNYGVDCSMNTLGALYGIEIDHFVRVNFTSVVKIVEELGGVEVYSEYEFKSIYGYHYDQGWNTITDGEEALAFVRERKNLPGGDNQRGKNQQAMITAMIKKAMSPAIVANYAGLLGSMEGNFETSMTSNDITELIKQYLDEGGEWNIVSQAVVGFDSENYCYSAPGYLLYVMNPDPDSVAAAAAKIQSVYDGAILESAAAQ